MAKSNKPVKVRKPSKHGTYTIYIYILLLYCTNNVLVLYFLKKYIIILLYYTARFYPHPVKVLKQLKQLHYFIILLFFKKIIFYHTRLLLLYKHYKSQGLNHVETIKPVIRLALCSYSARG